MYRQVNYSEDRSLMRTPKPKGFLLRKATADRSATILICSRTPLRLNKQAKQAEHTKA